MIVLSDHTAKQIRQALSERIANIGLHDTTGKTDELAELIEVLEKPLPENYGDCNFCVRENETCDKCEECTATHVSAFAMHWEPK